MNYKINVQITLYFFLSLVLPIYGCVNVDKNSHWSYGNFCGKDRPKAEAGTIQNRIAQLQRIPPIDDIDYACQQHDICYEINGTNNCDCDFTLMRTLLDMDFEKDQKLLCRSIGDQATAYFLLFHPSNCGPGLWIARISVALPVYVMLPIPLILGTYNQPETSTRCFQINRRR